MKQRYAICASAIAIIATMLGCGDDTGGGNGPVMGTAGTTAPPAGAGTGATPVAGTVAPPVAGGAAGRGTAGTSAPTGTAGAGTGGAGTGAAGSPMTPPTGASGMGASGTGAGGMGAGGAAPVAGGAAPVAGTGGAAGGGAEPGVVTNCGQAENVDQTKGPGPFTPTIIMNGGASGSAWVYYPMELGRDGCKHPIFNWGPGAGTGPSNYRDHLNHLASHGFVIISQPSSGNGTTEKASLEWLIKQNDTMGSPFHQKLDTKKVVMGGHSMGALTTFAMADWEPLTHYILVCGGSFGAPTGAQNIHGPTIILGGDTDTGTPNFEDDYEAIKSPVVFLIKSGTDHIACARNNLEPWTAFMRWQLYGETKWKADFFDGGKYCKAPWDSCESKNW